MKNEKMKRIYLKLISTNRLERKTDRAEAKTDQACRRRGSRSSRGSANGANGSEGRKRARRMPRSRRAEEFTAGRPFQGRREGSPGGRRERPRRGGRGPCHQSPRGRGWGCSWCGAGG